MTLRRIILFATIGLALLASAAAVAGYVAYAAIKAHQREQEELSREALHDKRTRVTYCSNLQFDPRNEQRLVNNTEEVFVARVVSVAGHEDNDPLPFLESWAPQTQFKVEILQVVKDSGNRQLRGDKIVLVNQLGVPPEDARAQISFCNEYKGGSVKAQKLETGTVYIFATEEEPSEGWHTVRVDPFGWMILGDNVGPKEKGFVSRLQKQAG